MHTTDRDTYSLSVKFRAAEVEVKATETKEKARLLVSHQRRMNPTEGMSGVSDTEDSDVSSVDKSDDEQPQDQDEQTEQDQTDQDDQDTTARAGFLADDADDA